MKTAGRMGSRTIGKTSNDKEFRARQLGASKSAMEELGAAVPKTSPSMRARRATRPFTWRCRRKAA